MIEAALGEPERVLADRTCFPLDEAHWKEFAELLVRPVRESPGLEGLFTKPNVFD